FGCGRFQEDPLREGPGARQARQDRRGEGGFVEERARGEAARAHHRRSPRARGRARDGGRREGDRDGRYAARVQGGGGGGRAVRVRDLDGRDVRAEEPRVLGGTRRVEEEGGRVLGGDRVQEELAPGG